MPPPTAHATLDDGDAPETVWVGDVEVAADQVRWLLNDTVTVCETHLEDAAEDMLYHRGFCTQRPLPAGVCTHCPT